MSKVFNWVFGSFFRTLGRIIAYLAIGFLVGYILNKVNFKWTVPSLLYMNVYAESINIRQTADGYVLINDNSNEYQTYIINPSANATLRVKIATALSESDIYSYMFMDVCSTRDINAIRTSSPGQSCTNSCWSNQVYTEKTDYVCTTNAQSGKIYRITTPIQKWEKDINDEMAYVNDQITIRNLTSDIISTTIYGVYVSNDTNNGTINIDYTNIINDIGNRQITAIDASTSAINNVAEEARQNTQDIINNQNANSQAEIDSQKVCKKIDYIEGSYGHYSITSNNGQNVVSTSLSNTNSAYIFDISEYIGEDIDIIFRDFTPSGINPTQYRNNYCFISDFPKNTPQQCISGNIQPIQRNNQTYSDITVPTGAKYLVMVGTLSSNLPNPENYFKVYLGKEICKNGNQALQDSMNDSNTSQASSEAGNFFNSFTTDTHGLTGIITAPLNAINSLTSSSCSPLVLPLPFVNENLSLPCMRDIYEANFGSFMALYDIITLGIISYWVMVRIFGLVKDFKNPEHDEIEVLDL